MTTLRRCPARTVVRFGATLVSLVVFAGLLTGSACSKNDKRAVPPPVKGGTLTESVTAADAAAPAAKTLAVSKLEPAFAAAQGPDRFAVVYTASVEGYVQPCGCTAEPLGGIARFAAAKAEADAAYGGRVLFVDGGDLLFEHADDSLPADVCQTGARHDLLIETYASLGLKVTALGKKDDTRGAAWRDERLAKADIVTLDTAQTTRAATSGARKATSFTQTLGTHKVAVLGYSLFGVDAKARIADIAAKLNAAAKKERIAGAEIVIVLAQSPRAMTKLVLQKVKGIDIAIQGDDPGPRPFPPEAIAPSGVVLVSAGLQAQYMGILEFVLEGERGPRLLVDDRQGQAARRAQVLKARVKQLTEKVRDAGDEAGRKFFAARLAKAKREAAQVFTDAKAAPAPAGHYVRVRALELSPRRPAAAAAAARLAAYEKAIPELVQTCEASIECEPPKPGTPLYVGEQACFACHKDAVTFWQKQKIEQTRTRSDGTTSTTLIGHSKAWQTLVEGGRDRDRTCVKCHSIGFNVPGGYCKTSEVDFRKNVQCEACHGPGSQHVDGAGDPTTLVQQPDEQTCRGCHHVPHIESPESFVYEDKLKLILGPGHGEVRWQALNATE